MGWVQYIKFGIQYVFRVRTYIEPCKLRQPTAPATSRHYCERGYRRKLQELLTSSVDRDSSVGIAARYGLDSPEIESQ